MPEEKAKEEYVQLVVNQLESAQRQLKRILLGLENGTITASLVQQELDWLAEDIQETQKKYTQLQESCNG